MTGRYSISELQKPTRVQLSWRRKQKEKRWGVQRGDVKDLFQHKHGPANMAKSRPCNI